jgi:hypothetical protein
MSQKSNSLTISKAVRFIAGQQESNGAFKSLSSPKPSFERAITYQTVFVPALILGSLAEVNTPASKRVSKGLAKFLLTQKSGHWSFNYWTVDSPQRKTMPYPDDLDDTFCALIGLYLHNPDLIDQSALVNVVRMLVATETKPGGPYRTWLVSGDSKKVWLDVDLAVNCNVAYFLGLTGSPLPTLQEFIENNCKLRSLKSPYYPNHYPILYYMSRAYEREKLDDLKVFSSKLLIKSEDLTPLKAALLLSSLLRLGADEGVEQLVEYLKSSQRKDGSWTPEAFCLDPARNGKLYYNGAAALTTAFAAEAFSLYDQSTSRLTLTQANRSTVAQDPRTRQTLKKIEVFYASTSPLVAKKVRPLIDQLSSGRNGAEIVGLPYRFNQAFKQTMPDVRCRVLDDLSLANLYGWMAYTIYDDFIDEEGQANLLSVANISMRQSLQHFADAVPACPPFRELVYRTFDTIDVANAWELENCRFDVEDGMIKIKSLPRYGRLNKLAERSLGHSLSVLAILCLEGVMPDSPDFKRTQKAFIHYLIAKQLNDDAHDWQEDLRKGHITRVVCVILNEAGVTPGSYKIDELMPKLQRQFWHNSLKSVCRDMVKHSSRGRQELSGVGVISSSNVIKDLLDDIEASVEETLNQQRQAKDFLKSYQKTSS